MLLEEVRYDLCKSWLIKFKFPYPYRYLLYLSRSDSEVDSIRYMLVDSSVDTSRGAGHVNRPFAFRALKTSPCNEACLTISGYDTLRFPSQKTSITMKISGINPEMKDVISWC